MFIGIQKLWVLLLLCLAVAGCATPAALLVGGAAAITAGSGTYLYLEGEVSSDYKASIEQVWAASERTVAQMRGRDVIPEKEIGRGTISAVIHAEKVTIRITYKERNVTTVAVRVGILGNRLSSQVIHDRIADNLARN